MSEKHIKKALEFTAYSLAKNYAFALWEGLSKKTLISGLPFIPTEQIKSEYDNHVLYFHLIEELKTTYLQILTENYL
jgi:hypothetical protein